MLSIALCRGVSSAISSLNDGHENEAGSRYLGYFGFSEPPRAILLNFELIERDRHTIGRRSGLKTLSPFRRLHLSNHFFCRLSMGPNVYEDV
jgi:hypothetical protein